MTSSISQGTFLLSVKYEKFHNAILRIQSNKYVLDVKWNEKMNSNRELDTFKIDIDAFRL